VFTARYELKLVIQFKLNSTFRRLVCVCLVTIGIKAGLCNYVRVNMAFDYYTQTYKHRLENLRKDERFVNDFVTV
jgi:hypothetical protein